MSTYVDGFVFVVPKKNLAAYRAMAKLGCKVWKKYGALDYKECMADDLKVKGALSFKTLTKSKPNELVFFSFITFKSRAHRDSVNKKVMADPAMNDPKLMGMVMPFDMKRMSYGGFTTVVE